jgi:uncharacterized protein (TIGR02246 family)
MEHSSKLAAEDEAAIRALLDRLGEAWARGDGQAYASVFSEDATFDNAPGQRVVGRQGIAASHQQIFDSVLTHTRLGGGYPVQLQSVTPDVVVVHASGAVLFAGEDEAKVPPNGLLTMVAATRGGRSKLAQQILSSLSPEVRERVIDAARQAFTSGFATTIKAAALVALVAAGLVMVLWPRPAGGPHAPKRLRTAICQGLPENAVRSRQNTERDRWVGSAPACPRRHGPGPSVELGSP